MGYGLAGLSLKPRPRDASFGYGLNEVLPEEALSLGARPPAPMQVPADAIPNQAAPFSMDPRAPQPAAAPPIDAFSLRPRVPSNDATLALKAAAGDYSSAPTAGSIKAAAGVSADPGALSLSPRPPMPVSIPASAGPGYESASPPGPSLPSRAVAGAAPRPPLRSYSESYGRFQDERAKLGTEQEYLAANKPKGFMGRVGNALKLGGKALVASGFNPITALAGAAIGAADPNSYARYNYRTDIEPRSLYRQEGLLRQAGTELGMENTLRDDDRAQQQMELTNSWHQLQVRTHDEQERKELQEKTLNDWQARNPGVPIPKEIADEVGRPFLSGYVPPARPIAGRTMTPRWELNKNNVYVDLNDPANRNVEGYHDPDKPAKPTDADYESEALAGRDRSTERMRRIDEMLPWAYSRLGVDQADALPEDRMRVQSLAEDTVDKAMKDELGQDTARARVAGRRGERLGGTSLGPRPSATAAAGPKRKLTPADVKSYGDANGWTPEQAASYLRSTGRYIVP